MARGVRWAVGGVLAAALVVVGLWLWGEKRYEEGYARGEQEMALLKDSLYIGMLTNLAQHPLLRHSREDRLVFRNWQEEELKKLLAQKALIDASPYKDTIYGNIRMKVFVDNATSGSSSP
jgi:hypothetical protein